MPDPTISNATTVAPAANAAPAIAAPAPSVPATPPNLSGLAQPGVGVKAAPAPGMPTPTMSDVEGQYAEAQKDYQAAQKIAQQPTTPAPVPHARLMAMVTGLARGLSAFGESLATRGKEGGAPQVAQEYAQDQELQMQKDQAARENQARQAQLQIVAGDNAMKMGQMYTYLMTLPDDVQAHHAAAISAATDATQKAFDLGMQTGDFSQYNSLKGAQGGAPVTGAPPQATQSWKTAVDAANTALPNDPVIAQQVKIAADPNSTPQQLAGAARIASQRAQEMGAALKSVKADDPLAKFETPDGLQAPGAVASLQAIAQDPNTTPANAARANALIPKADAAQKAVLMQHDLETKADQAVRNGDPAAAGALLASGDTTISELKSRGMTPEYITQAINAAKKIVPGYNAIKADNDAKVAGSEQNNQFFGSANSLVQPGGTLDQLAAIGGKISASDYKLLNKTQNWASLETGGGPIAAYVSTLVGVADDYSKVMGGGTGSDTSRAMVLKILDPSLSPDQRTAAIAAARAAVNSQKSARIGNNSFLQKMYGSTSENGAQNGVQQIPVGAQPILKGNQTVGYILNGRRVDF
jgi:hypothetical protein